jgi:hypothetical protein
MATCCQRVQGMMYSPPHGVLGNSEHSELRPPKGFPVTAGAAGVSVVRVTPSDPVALASVNRNSGVCATLTVIDAQYPPYREKFTELEQAKEAGQSPPVPPDLTAALVNNVPGLDDKTRGMDGAVADGLSRLVLRLEINAASTPIGQVTFTLTSASSLASHHDQYPLGTLSTDGFTIKSPGTELTVDTKPGPNGRLVAVAVYTPPLFFPYTADAAQPATVDLKLKAEAGSTTVAKTTIRLVRSPLLVQHGLFGSAARAIGQDMKKALNTNGQLLFMPDFGERNISGFDRVFDVLPRGVSTLTTAFRGGTGDSIVSGDRGSTDVIAGKKIATTTVDVLAHSIGGVLVRWYTTDRIAGGVPPSVAAVPSPAPREIQYPATGTVTPGLVSGTGPTAPEGRYAAMQRQRDVKLNYRRADNFYRGDFGNVVVYGSPLRGSPLGNEATQEICPPDLRQQCFQPPPPLFSWQHVVYRLARPQPEDAPDARTQPDAGAGIYDLSMGSTAYQMFSVDSDPVRVHAIGTTASALSGLQTWVTNPTHYCQGFNRTTSDRVVPIESQLANFGHGHYTRIDGAIWHQYQDQELRLQLRVVDLLVDTPGNTDPAANFEDRFPADASCYPLECGAPQCQPR